MMIMLARIIELLLINCSTGFINHHVLKLRWIIRKLNTSILDQFYALNSPIKEREDDLLSDVFIASHLSLSLSLFSLTCTKQTKPSASAT